jgi:hypothetical protein
MHGVVFSGRRHRLRSRRSVRTDPIDRRAPAHDGSCGAGTSAARSSGILALVSGQLKAFVCRNDPQVDSLRTDCGPTRVGQLRADSDPTQT